MEDSANLGSPNMVPTNFADGSSRRVREPSLEHNNSELLLWSLFVCGGTEDWVDVEDWFVAAWKLAPERLSWRTIPDYPDYKKCSKALQELEDPKRSDHLGLVARKDRYTRKLTLAGADWCRRWEQHLSSLYSKGEIPKAQTTYDAGLVPRIRKSELFVKFQNDPTTQFQRWEMADLLRCQPESKLPIWRQRCEEIEVAARHSGDTEVIEFCRALLESILSVRNKEYGN